MAPSDKTLTPEVPSFRRLLLVLCCIWAVLNFNVLFGGRVLPWDAIDQFYPTVYFNAHTLRSGSAPWWNPYIYGGYPQIGDPQGMMFSPLLMGWMLLRQDPGAVWFSWGVLLHLLMGGVAMLTLLRRYGGSSFGWLLGATVFMAGGVAASRLEHTPDVIAYAYVPVVLLAWRWLLANPGWKRGAVLGLAAGAMVTQLVQITYLFVLVIVADACIGTARRWPTYDAANRRGWCAGVAVAVAVASVIGLPQLLFSWAVMSQSNRVELPLSAAANGSLDWRAFVLLINPNAFDALRKLHEAPFDVVASFLYIGAIPLLALYGLRRCLSVPALRVVLACHGVLLVVATIYMLGTHTPFYGWLYSWLPGLAHLRRPADAAYLFNLALAVISGIAASRIHLSSRRDTTVLLAIAGCWLAVTGASMVGRHVSAILPAVMVAISVWQLRRTGSEWRATLWLMAVVAADYRTFNLGGTFNASGNPVARFVASPAARYVAEKSGQEDGALPARISTVDTTVTWDNTVVLIRVSSTQGYNPLRYGLFEQWYRPRDSSNAEAGDAPYNKPPRKTLDDLLAVRYLVAGHRHGNPTFTPPTGYTRVHTDKDVDIWRNEHAYRHILNPREAILLDPGHAPDVAQFTATDFASKLWLTPRDQEDFAAAETLAGNCSGVVQGKIVDVKPTATELQLDASSAGWLVMSEMDYPGWTASVDGEPVAIHRANGMFRAICVPAGRHRLRMDFHPWLMVAHAWHNLRQA